MPQFIQEITSVSHSLTVASEDELAGPKNTGRLKQRAEGEATFSPKEFMMPQVLMDDS